MKRTSVTDRLDSCRTLRFAAACVLLSLVACGPPDAPRSSPNSKPVIYTTFYPTQYFTHRITGDLAVVVCPVPTDADPLFWKPDAESVQAMQDADMIVLNGANLEKWLDAVTLPTERLVDTTLSLRGKFIEPEATTHSRGSKGEHSHQGTDSHTWLDPIIALTQAEAIHSALARRFESHAPQFAKGFESLAKDLGNLDAELRRLGKPTSTLLASHPAYNYVARRYDWRVVNLDLDPEIMPDPATLTEILGIVESENATYLLWESPPAPDVAQAFKSIGLTNVEFSPCELVDSSDKDYLTVMIENLQRLKVAFD